MPYSTEIADDSLERVEYSRVVKRENAGLSGSGSVVYKFHQTSTAASFWSRENRTHNFRSDDRTLVSRVTYSCSSAIQSRSKDWASFIPKYLGQDCCSSLAPFYLVLDETHVLNTHIRQHILSPVLCACALCNRLFRDLISPPLILSSILFSSFLLSCLLSLMYHT